MNYKIKEKNILHINKIKEHNQSSFWGILITSQSKQQNIKTQTITIDDTAENISKLHRISI